MLFLDPHLSFDVNKPFYPLVTAYVVQVHGFIEMASRGLILKLKEAGPEGVQQALAYQGLKENGFDETVENLSKSGTTALLAKQELESKVLTTRIKVDLDILANEVFHNNGEPMSYFNRMSAGSLIILAYELTESFHTHDPLWEFLRHCRNAAAHKGYFNFKGNQPNRPAKWRTLEIEPSLQGKPLFYDPPTPGFLGIGDTLYLLWDIEQRFPNIQ